MVSYYNSLSYSQKHNTANLTYSAATGQPWQWPSNYGPHNHQFFSEMDSPQVHHTPMYYNPHHVFHATTTNSASEWHSPVSSTSVENFPPNFVGVHHALQQQHHLSSGNGSNGSTSTGSVSAGSISVNTSGNTHLNETSTIQEQHIEGLPSPPITVSGSEISSPGAPPSTSSPQYVTPHLANSSNSPANQNHNSNTNIHNNNTSIPLKSQYYDWMKKPSYPAQPATGKTRTKDKYRVVYTDFQRLELEKEYCTSRYITIRRKAELAQTLSLSERQVKIWFQNRRAKERKQNKKVNDSSAITSIQHSSYINLMNTKPKLEPGIHLQHPLHSLNITVPTMRLHPHIHNHHSFAITAAHSHQLQQTTEASMPSSTSVSSIPM